MCESAYRDDKNAKFYQDVGNENDVVLFDDSWRRKNNSYMEYTQGTSTNTASVTDN